jgi:hypothetical protein
MSRRSLGTIVVVLLASLAFPNTAHSSIIDWIWTMSGPQMIGFPLHCEYDLENNKWECREIDRLFAGQLKPRRDRKTWVSFDTGPYFSTGYDSDEGTDFEWFKTWMVAFEPVLEIRSHTSPGGAVMLHHGLVGLSYDVLFGSGFDTFDKFGLKFKPIGVTIKKRFNAAFTMRWYPNGFTRDEFGYGPRQDFNRDGEMLYGFSIGYIWGRIPPT